MNIFADVPENQIKAAELVKSGSHSLHLGLLVPSAITNPHTLTATLTHCAKLNQKRN